jgi:hypothetical protein
VESKCSRVRGACLGGAFEAMVADALTFLNRKRVFDFAAEHRLPVIYETSAFARDGGLMSYGPDENEAAERGANLVLRVLKGEKPADLPLEQPTRFRLVINLKTASVTSTATNIGAAAGFISCFQRNRTRSAMP